MNSSSLQIFEAFKTVDGKEENRLFAIVKSGNSTAVFVFSFSNYPPITLNDLRIESVEPVHDKLSIIGDVGAFQFQLVNDCNASLYHYSSGDETRRSKETFERLLKKLTQGKAFTDMTRLESVTRFCVYSKTMTCHESRVPVFVGHIRPAFASLFIKLIDKTFF